MENFEEYIRHDDFSVKDAHRSGRPSKIDNNEMKALVQANKHSTVRELATSLKVSVGSVHDHLKSLGFVKKLDVWVPHELKEIHLTNPMSVCDQLIKREENDPFLKRMIMGDEKWIVYNNISRKRSLSKRDETPERQAKAEIHQKKLQKLSDAIAQKRPELINRKGVMFHHDKRPYMRDHTQFGHSAKIVATWLGCVLTSMYSQTLHHQTSISFAPCKTP
ncbi:PREDICTED: histone-lysine N-methyltransferase SETMAR-like [Atta cephalotes]|uniref:Histone-lysine N-methyltransferase SETMAR n=1 Tax=Atta cephalotes TaxID=12957 RepID=A0A158NWW6_ATTCE|nr:PREDICTED: histone-lysine N-methyltransferase SETMAR-like [Atta cephalotes]